MNKSSSTSRLSDRQFSNRQFSGSNPRKEPNVKSNRWKKLVNPMNFTRKNYPPMTILSNSDLSDEPPILSIRDFEKIQNLLLCELISLADQPKLLQVFELHYILIYDSLTSFILYCVRTIFD